MRSRKRRLEVSIGKTINLGNYESIKIHVGLAYDISNTADLDEAYDELFEECSKQLTENEDNIIGRKK